MTFAQLSAENPRSSFNGCDSNILSCNISSTSNVIINNKTHNIDNPLAILIVKVSVAETAQFVAVIVDL